jgi:hypothetical protein
MREKGGREERRADLLHSPRNLDPPRGRQAQRHHPGISIFRIHPHRHLVHERPRGLVFFAPASRDRFTEIINLLAFVRGADLLGGSDFFGGCVGY